MATKALLKKLFSAKCNYDSDGFCHSFENLSEEEITKLLIRVAKEIYGIEVVLFSKIKNSIYTYSWYEFKYGMRDKYRNFLENTGLRDISKDEFFPRGRFAEFSKDVERRLDYYQITNLYFPCKNEKDCIGYLFVPMIGSIDIKFSTNKLIAHELSHIIVSGKRSRLIDYGYNDYMSSDNEFIASTDKENVLESVAIVYTYVFGSFLGVYKSSGSINDMIGVDYILDTDEHYILTCLKVLRELDLIDDQMKPNFMISSKTIEQVRHEMDSYLNE